MHKTSYKKQLRQFLEQKQNMAKTVPDEVEDGEAFIDQNYFYRHRSIRDLLYLSRMKKNLIISLHCKIVEEAFIRKEHRRRFLVLYIVCYNRRFLQSLKYWSTNDHHRPAMCNFLVYHSHDKKKPDLRTSLAMELKFLVNSILDQHHNIMQAAGNNTFQTQFRIQYL